jgi:hypothetical protein
MHVRFLAPELPQLDALRCEAIALPYFEDERPLRGALGLADWRLCGLLSRMLSAGRLTGEALETVLVPARPKLAVEKLFMFGLGPRAALDDAARARAQQHMLDTLALARVRTSALVLPGRSVLAVPAADAFETFVRAALPREDHDELIVLEPHAAQREMEPVLERERRRARAEMI